MEAGGTAGGVEVNGDNGEGGGGGPRQRRGRRSRGSSSEATPARRRGGWRREDMEDCWLCIGSEEEC